MDQAEDLRAFERRMVEIVSSLQPSIRLWRLTLSILVLITSTTFYYLIKSLIFSSSSSSAADVKTENSSYFFRIEVYCLISSCLLICAFLFGIHRKIFASNTIVSRFRYVLTDYNMSCDDRGRLMIRPRPITIF